MCDGHRCVTFTVATRLRSVYQWICRFLLLILKFVTSYAIDCPATSDWNSATSSVRKQAALVLLAVQQQHSDKLSSTSILVLLR
jgi:hypothetical protein